MPIIRDTPLPVPAGALQELHDSLSPQYGYALVMHGARNVLVMRVPHDTPDRERDLARAADLVTLEEAALARDLLLVAEEKTVRVDPIPLRDVIRERLQEDLPVAKEMRRHLPRQAAVALVTPSTRRHPCLAIRLPQARCRDASAHDLEAVRQALEPVLQQAAGVEIPLAYLVADEDFRRFTPEGLVRVLTGEAPLKPPKDGRSYQVAGETRPGAAGGGTRRTPTASGGAFGLLLNAAERTSERMADRRSERRVRPGAASLQTVAGDAPPAGPAESAPVVPAAAAAVPAALANVAGASTGDQGPGDAAEDPASLVLTVAERLSALGFEVLGDLGDDALALAAHHPDGKKLLVSAPGPASASSLAALRERLAALEADAALLLATTVEPGALLRAAGGPVAVVPVDRVEAWLR